MPGSAAGIERVVAGWNHSGIDMTPRANARLLKDPTGVFHPMIMRMFLGTSIMAMALFAGAQPQTTAPKSAAEPGLPRIQEPVQTADSQQTGMMSGNRPFFLTTDTDGEIVVSYDENKELSNLTAKKGVIFSSEDMTLNADQVDFNNSKSELIASGNKVIVRQGEVIATCQLFKYYPDEQRSELAGNPIIYNKSREGKVNTTAGERISIYTVDGKPQIKIKGGRRAPILQSGQEAPVPASNIPAGAGDARLMGIDAKAPSGPGTSIMSGTSSATPSPSPTPGQTQGVLPQMPK